MQILDRRYKEIWVTIQPPQVSVQDKKIHVNTYMIQMQVFKNLMQYKWMP